MSGAIKRVFLEVCYANNYIIYYITISYISYHANVIIFYNYAFSVSFKGNRHRLILFSLNFVLLYIYIYIYDWRYVTYVRVPVGICVARTGRLRSAVRHTGSDPQGD